MSIYRTTISVEWGDCDPAGIVYYPRYFAWFDQCTLGLFSEAGFALQDMLAEREGFGGLPLVEAKANFMMASRCGDTLDAETELTEIRGSRFTVRHRLSREGRLAVEGYEIRAWTTVDPADRRRLKGAPMPPEVVAALRG
ncbi:MAG: acyl-CoA thioesterase [Rhodospirillales bacterium]|nr:acyl-CoA thioesterase [Rhodospirillales bacterium]